ncbi:MAG TPA: sulfatase-like hydrolase/transferase [Nocardioides sp.]|nr:sulfatase-like hydrolase/transferase [Nocardioides sp.]
MLLVILSLNVPDQIVPGEFDRDTFVPLPLESFFRLPIEAVVFLAVVLVLPSRLGRVRTALALVAGIVFALSAVFRLLDIGFVQALNRPFDPLIDWTYARSLVELLRDSFGQAAGTALLVAGALLAVALLVLLPLALLRLTRVAVRHRREAVPVVAALAALWLALALFDVRGDAGNLASRDTSDYVYDQVSRIPSELRDQQRFAEAAENDPLRDVPARQLVSGLRGKDVLFVFVESYGRVAIEDSSFAPGVEEVLARGNRQLDKAGFSSRSAFLTSPTFGALSWLAHATFQSGLWVDSQQRYDLLVTGSHLTLSHVFGRAGWRTVAAVPANTRDWPQGEFYEFDHIYDSRNIGYEGPRFGYPTMPDQFTLDAIQRLELAEEDRPPVMAEIDLITSHAPWSRTPRLIDQSRVGDGSVFDGMPGQLPSAGDIWPSPTRIRAAYGDAIEYSLSALFRFLTTYGDEDLVVVMLGDHQPATIVSGDGAGRDVPISVIAQDPAVLDAISGWNWDPGLHPEPDAPVWPMDAFRDRFLAAYGTGAHTGNQPVGGR